MEHAGADAASKHRDLLPGIQLLRGAAALLVVVAHVAGLMGHAEYFGRVPLPVLGIGVFGVAVFFVISGFIIAIVSLGGDFRPRLTRADYAKRRFMRIVPFMWLCVIGYNVLALAGTGAVEWGPALRAMVAWPVGELKPNVIWSLRHEFLFYLLFALTMLGRRRHPVLLSLWFLAPLLLWTALLPFAPAATPWHPYNNEWARVLLLGSETGANLQLGAGFLLGLAWLRRGRWMMDWLRHGLLASLALTIAGAAIITWWPVGAGLGRTLLWTALGAVTVYAGIVARSTPGPLRRTGLALGNASFSIYLTHNPILLVLLAATAGFRDAMPPIAWLVCYSVIMTLGGIAVHRLVEKPVIAWAGGGRLVAPWLLPRRSARR